MKPLLLLLAILTLSAAPPPQTEPKPFGLPFTTPPGPSTWFLIQGYGNTLFAYRDRTIQYGKGQGFHFGVDLGAPCGTTVVAIGDGTVTQVDSLAHGAGPHNLMILHPNGLASFYGHLLERPKLSPGQTVTRGQPIALTGDPDLTCHSRPHLHLEIRNNNYSIAYNPINYIDADWESLALSSSGGVPFARDIDNPRQWQSMEDQPDTHFGQALLNDYANPWPPDWRNR